jgi:hypothetical protein
MPNISKISLSVPELENHNRKYFTFSLKQKLNNENAEYPQASKIIAISDIEGNFEALRKLLLFNHVIDKNYHWIFENGHLVILGDCFDRGNQVIECLWLIYSLEDHARREGGHVHFILGNHEIMNLNGDWRYLHPKYAIKNSNAQSPISALYGANSELWSWLLTKNVVEKIGDLLFVHGGISKELLQLNLSLTQINDLARPHYQSAYKAFTNPVLDTILTNDKSPLWYRGYYTNSIIEEDIDAILAHFDVKTIITGHSIVEKISTFFSGKVINIDTAHANGLSEALLIENSQFYRKFRSKKEKIK